MNFNRDEINLIVNKIKDKAINNVITADKI
jgi:hypothetical protein